MKRFDIFSPGEKRLFFSITLYGGISLFMLMMISFLVLNLLESEEHIFWVIGFSLAVYAPLVIILTAVKNKEILKKFALSFSPVPSKWREFISDNSSYYSFLDKKTKKRFERDLKYLLLKSNIKGKEEREVSLELRLLIAVGMATFLIGRPEWTLPLPNEIVVLPGDHIVRDLKNGKGKVKLAALCTRETMYLTEKNLSHSFHRFSDGYNNIFHEIAHYFDTEDYNFDGAPLSQKFSREHKDKAFEYKIQWSKALENEFEKLRKGEFQLRPDAASNIGELFACATELFFEDPKRLNSMSRELYGLLQSFYNFDPLELLQIGK